MYIYHTSDNEWILFFNEWILRNTKALIKTQQKSANKQPYEKNKNKWKSKDLNRHFSQEAREKILITDNQEEKIKRTVS